MKNKIVIATRKSLLALYQANAVKERLNEKFPSCRVELLPVVTKGDRVLDKPLSRIGGKGLFIKELEHALLLGEADIAVHSLKDVPGDLPELLSIEAVLPRGDARDVLLSKKYNSLSELPQGAIVGTSSLRRMAQVKAMRLDVIIHSLRGNVETRIRKMEEGQYDAIVLAAAGVIRLGLEDKITEYFPLEKFIPAASQAIMAVETRTADRKLVSMLKEISDEKAMTEARAERAFLKEMGGSCQIPAGMISTLHGDTITGTAMMADEDGTHIRRASAEDPADSPEELGIRLAHMVM